MRPAKPCFVNAWVDGAMMGGLSIAAYLFLRVMRGPHAEATVGAITLWSYSYLINGTHFAATNYRLYRSRESLRQYPLTAAAVPLAALGGLWASFRWPHSVAPYFVKLFLLWSPYHYSGQTLGLSQVYARRAGFELSTGERRALSCVAYGIFAAAVIRGEVGAAPGDFLGVRFPALGLPGWTSTASLAALAGFAIWGAFLFGRRALSGQTVPWLVLLPSIAQFFWNVLGPDVRSFYQLVPMFHGLQYLLVAWFMQVQTVSAEQGAARTPGFLAAQTARWTAWNLAGYLLLFWAIPQAAAWVSGTPMLFAGAVAMAAVQTHHFFVDGVIWKLRDPRVASPLTAELA